MEQWHSDHHAKHRCDLSADDTQRTAQITNRSAQNDTLHLTYSSAGQADVDLIWTPTTLTLTSGGQTAEWAHIGNITFSDLSDVARAIARFGTFADGFEEDQLHAINKKQSLARLISTFIFFVLYLDDIGGIT